MTEKPDKRRGLSPTEIGKILKDFAPRRREQKATRNWEEAQGGERRGQASGPSMPDASIAEK